MAGAGLCRGRVLEPNLASVNDRSAWGVYSIVRSFGQTALDRHSVGQTRAQAGSATGDAVVGGTPGRLLGARSGLDRRHLALHGPVPELELFAVVGDRQRIAVPQLVAGAGALDRNAQLAALVAHPEHQPGDAVG